ncbi:hypothetical protein Afil01_66490 [Actinorhabdospora filicis]|uniref:DUF3558 domain-containing protein n=1 Tax=Actinorhabdospora filicis TaxID=1785913 RepID=A0A9W6SU25_9ACTN|nr:hypothetical protein [Actinorhabdospora filicis]GLZ81842.1 hypothetical protein Afil01_66490 [Actinorhabdospora filicis]
MTSPFPPPSPSEWGRDGAQPPDDPPASSPTQYELYPADGGWPEQQQQQPVTGPPYPQHPPAYTPPPPPPVYQQPVYQVPPPVVQYPQPVAYPQPVVVQTRNNNKGWIIGGVIALVVILGCGGGWLALRGVISGIGDAAGGGSDDPPMAYSASVPAAPSNGRYKTTTDYCATFTSTRLTTVLKLGIDGTPANSNSDYGDGTGNGSCSFSMNTDANSSSRNGYDYAMFSMHLTIDNGDYNKSAFESSKQYMMGTEVELKVGAKSYATWQSDTSRELKLAILDGNMLLELDLYTSQENATQSAFAALVQDTANEIMTSLG